MDVVSLTHEPAVSSSSPRLYLRLLAQALHNTEEREDYTYADWQGCQASKPLVILDGTISSVARLLCAVHGLEDAHGLGDGECMPGTVSDYPFRS
mmetsp:Transcript_19012/g.48663  ORF Transcript_19012/g.48663 Transcript_19012/m.48663 type:complete len:95 (-) Transcript_19012:484-768(-)